jgi:Ca2+/Na+ antiporter
VHVGKYKHVNISIIYASLQALINIIVIALPLQGRLSAQLSILFIFTITLCAVYIFIRNKYTKKRVIRLRETEEAE